VSDVTWFGWLGCGGDGGSRTPQPDQFNSLKVPTGSGGGVISATRCSRLAGLAAAV